MHSSLWVFFFFFINAILAVLMFVVEQPGFNWEDVVEPSNSQAGC